VAAAARAGLKPVLILRGTEPEEYTANALLDKIFGAEIVWITEDQYKEELDTHFNLVSEDLKKRGYKPYSIPEGASNALGAIGYLAMMRELKNQLNVMHFDSIVCAVGSAGTIAGLIMGKKIFGIPSNIIGFNVCDTADFYINKTFDIIEDAKEQFKFNLTVSKDEITIIDGYVGTGYAQATEEEIKLYIDISRKEGILFDHVYTGKAMRGMIDQIKHGNKIFGNNILFIHTGGLFGVFSQQSFINKNL